MRPVEQISLIADSGWTGESALLHLRLGLADQCGSQLQARVCAPLARQAAQKLHQRA